MNFYIALTLLLLTATLSSASITQVDVLKLPDINAWEKQVFSGITSYELHEIDGQQVLKAISKQSASGLVRENVLDDKNNLLGIDATRIDAVAIMTDTDYSRQSATAYYGDIFFISE